MQWVTRKGVKFDRAACAWLILRHIDPQATFGYLEAEQMQPAIDAGARPFHNITWGGPGSRTTSSFEDLLAGYHLDDPALAEMGRLINSAEIKGEASGTDDPLRAIAKGMNALASSDQEMVDRMLPVFDALYAYCKRKVAGQTKWASLEPGWGQG